MKNLTSYYPSYEALIKYVNFSLKGGANNVLLKNYLLIIILAKCVQ